jgi:2-polyprenyl-3-methyl-5-hydroxy-6-metoxy-1,4-benzoquinol methylase
MSTYVFDPAWKRERDRLDALEALFDTSTVRLLSALGIREGWRCLEVGCGAGGIAIWLADRVGDTGRVLATDVETRFLGDPGRGNLTVLTHNIGTDDLETGAFHLVHARAVLEHVPARHDVLGRLVSALAPGGWLLVEDFDFGPPTATALAHYVWPDDVAQAAERVYLAAATVFAATGADASYGRRLAPALTAAGLVNVGAEIHAPMIAGGTDSWTRGSIEQLADRLPGTGLTSPADVELFLATTAQPSTFYAPPLLISAWGQRPPAGNADLPRGT